MESRENIAAMKLIKTIETSNNICFEHFIHRSVKNDFIKACIEVKNIADWSFQFTEFYKILSDFHLPLEFLWHLHSFQVMPLEFYILNIYSEDEKKRKFQASVVYLFLQDVEGSEVEYLVQTGFLTYFVYKAFPTTDDTDKQKIIYEICIDTLTVLLKGLFSNMENQFSNKRYTGFYSLWNAGILEKVTLQEFCSYAIKLYFETNPQQNDLDTFQLFEGPNLISSHLLNLIEKLLKPQKLESICHTFTSTVQNLVFNLKNLLTFVKAFSTVHQESSLLIQKILSDLMNEAYKNSSYNLLLRVILIARQATSQATLDPLICFKNWLQFIFKDSGHLKNANNFSLLIQVLSDFVPFYKNIQSIKIAIEFNVSVPSEVKSTYNDYIILLKTRIQDLKPQVKPEETVQKMLSLYEILGKIPPVIMETSLLQKHKFLNEFLPVLLTPRVVPQIPDSKEKFIEALNKAGKIPSNLLQKYRSGCQNEEESLLSDITMLDDNFDDFIKDDDDDVILLSP